MANEEYLKILEQGVDVWNEWRRRKSGAPIDLRAADLANANLRKANLYSVNLEGARLNSAYLSEAILARSILRDADLQGANCRHADFNRADSTGADLAHANLFRANFESASLINANLTGAKLSEADLRNAQLNSAIASFSSLIGANIGEANLRQVDLSGADLSYASFYETILADLDLTKATGLNACRHLGPSVVDHRTIARSKTVPLVFWRGCGLPDALIDYMPSLTGDAIQFFSCFISYSSRDQEFADRLHADLQNVGVRCWFAPHDLPIGAKTWDGIDQAIRTRDKVLLILSEGALASDWVEDEVTTAFEEERRRKRLVLFPVRIDDAVMKTSEPWAGKLRANRNIGDFSLWKDHDAYKATFERVLRDLKAGR